MLKHKHLSRGSKKALELLIAPGSPGSVCAGSAVHGNQFAEFPDGAVS